jgi:hypothetical protein
VRSLSTQRRLIAGLGVLVLLAAITLAWLLRGAGDDPAVRVASAASADATVASAAVKDTVLEVASEAATWVYGYTWTTLADDKADARALLTGEMLDQYDRTMAGVATSSRRDHTVVTASVVGAALVHASSSDARVLVFVNQSTTRDDLEEPLLNLDRVLVTLERDGDEWKVSELDAL